MQVSMLVFLQASRQGNAGCTADKEGLKGLLACRFSFKLSPGQVPLDVVCPLLMKPTTGVFVTPVLRNEE